MLAHGFYGEHTLAMMLGLVGTLTGLLSILANQRAHMVTPLITLACAAGIVGCGIHLYGEYFYDSFGAGFLWFAFPIAILGSAGLIMAVGRRYAPRDPNYAERNSGGHQTPPPRPPLSPDAPREQPPTP